ncbi:hypothetical protein QWT69_11065 [Sporosarcina oncorhynchi]|uniref:Peptidase C39-like domain-containing protein n=1 Tax=Sporosarcina oncorhynchi TaxID=3056444 RepID=A0ABZ0L1I2_9BACL|nr:hypothetical protein [Sporosarcina sp. T2O-4]WOV86454.1 hypothetical protein QWT69_11065 [Sporosarcina sp. T2O-4]
MTVLKSFVGKSQFGDDIDNRYKTSACGPVTVYTILNYHLYNTGQLPINTLYRLLGGTKIGLFTWRLIRNLRKLLGPSWVVQQCDIDELKLELDAGRPVAAKFDKWFTFHWFGTFSYDYHWVPVIGYKMSNQGLLLIVHDNGGRQRDSRIREIPYEPNRKILSFVQIKKTTAD